MSAPSLALEPDRRQKARNTLFDRYAHTSVINFADSSDFVTPPLTLPDGPESVDFGTATQTHELPTTSQASPEVTAPHTSVSEAIEKTDLTALPTANLPAEQLISDHPDSAVNNLRATFEQSLNQTLDHLKQYLLAAVEAQIKTSVQTAELPAPQEFLAQVRDIVQAAVAPNTFPNHNHGNLGGLRPLPKLSFLNRPHGKWVDPILNPTTDKKPTPSIPPIATTTNPPTLEASEAKIHSSTKATPFITNPIPSPTDKLPWETQSPFV